MFFYSFPVGRDAILFDELMRTSSGTGEKVGNRPEGRDVYGWIRGAWEAGTMKGPSGGSGQWWFTI